MTSIYEQILQKGLQARQANHRQQALALFKDAVACDPGQLPAYREAGVECRELGLFSEAEGFFQQALARRPGDLATVIHQAICSRRQGKHELCLQQLMAVAEKNIKNGHLCKELGTSLKELGRLEEAGQWFLRALAESPTNIHILSEYGLVARMLGKRELALAQFETITRHHPTHIPAYLEASTELQALGRQLEALEKLQRAFVQIQDRALLEKYLVLLFELDGGKAVHQLFLHAAYYPISDVLIQHFSNYALTGPAEKADITTFPKNLVVALFSQEQFAMRMMNLRTGRYDSFIALLSYFEPVLVELIGDQHRALMNDRLFLLLIVFAWYKRNGVVKPYVIAHAGQYIARYPFSDLCRVSASLVALTSPQQVLSWLAEGAIGRHSITCLLACLVMRGYYPDEPCLEVFDDKASLLGLLPSFCVPDNAAVLKNIFTHLLQKEKLTIDDVGRLYPEIPLLESVKAVDDALKPVFQANHQQFVQAKKLKVALCISGQLRGYQKAYDTIKKTLVDPLQPDIFVHTWKDVGFKEPFPNKMASSRVFQGHFLTAYLNLAFLKNYSYPEIKRKLPTVFALFNKNASVTPEQLKEFYQTDFVVVEDDGLPPYAALNNQQKMFYKIDACNELLKASGRSYDLVIRLRPDKELHGLAHTDWGQVAEVCNSGKAIYINCFTGLSNFYEGGAYHLGDIVAIGSQSTMNFYARVPTFQETFLDQGLAYFERVGQRSQSMLGHGLFLGGYAARDIPLKLGDFINTSLKAEDILQAINQDLGNLDQDVAESLVEALKQDILDQT